MALMQGAAAHLNIATGTSNTVAITDDQISRFGDRVLRAGLILHDKNGVLYHTDGIHSLKVVLTKPLIADNVEILTRAERELIANHGKADGFVVTDNNNKIPDEQLNFVKDELINPEYLQDYLTPEGGLKIELFPAEVRQHLHYVRDYDTLLALSGEDNGHLTFVIDASKDERVNSGWGLYAWGDRETIPDMQPPEGDVDPKEARWALLACGELLDIDPDSFVTTSSVTKAGAVMYDHTIKLKRVSLDMLAELNDVATTHMPRFAHWDDDFDIYPNEQLPIPIEVDERFSRGNYLFTISCQKCKLTLPDNYNTNNGTDIVITDKQPVTVESTAKAFNDWLRSGYIDGEKYIPYGPIPGSVEVSIEPIQVGDEPIPTEDQFKITCTSNFTSKPYSSRTYTESVFPVDEIVAYKGLIKDLPGFTLDTRGWDPEATYSFSLRGVNQKFKLKGKHPDTYHSMYSYVTVSGTMEKINEILAAGFEIEGGTEADELTLFYGYTELCPRISVKPVPHPHPTHFFNFYYSKPSITIDLRLDETNIDDKTYTVRLMPQNCRLVHNNDVYLHGRELVREVNAANVAMYNRDVLARLKIENLYPVYNSTLVLKVQDDTGRVIFKHVYTIRKLSKPVFTFKERNNCGWEYSYPYNAKIAVDPDRMDEIHTVKITATLLRSYYTHPETGQQVYMKEEDTFTYSARVPEVNKFLQSCTPFAGYSSYPSKLKFEIDDFKDMVFEGYSYVV